MGKSGEGRMGREEGTKKMILGWGELEKATGLSRYFIGRAIKLYGFPKAERTGKTGVPKARVLAWDHDTVLWWMILNKDVWGSQKLHGERLYAN
jgi:predicted DNA-binding transcriptional regulator AlpA